MAALRKATIVLAGLLVVGFFASNQPEKGTAPRAEVGVTTQPADQQIISGSKASAAFEKNKSQSTAPITQLGEPGVDATARPSRKLLTSVKRSLEGENDSLQEQITSSETVQRKVFAQKKVRMRAGPGTHFPVVATIEINSSLDVFAISGDWLRVSDKARSGWVRQDLVGESQTVLEDVPALRSPAIQKPLVKRALAVDRSGQPTRDAYVGSCDCPYDLMRNGRKCGNRSAYSRPGGRNPQCYF